MTTLSLLQRDALATAAAAYLSSAVAAFKDIVNFPDADAAEEATLDLLRDFDVLPDGYEHRHAYIEPGCVEHGVVHVYVTRQDPEGSGYWLEIDPVTGKAVRC